MTELMISSTWPGTRLMGADEEGTHERLKAHLGRLVEPKIKKHRGHTVKNTGDGLLAEFPTIDEPRKEFGAASGVVLEIGVGSGLHNSVRRNRLHWPPSRDATSSKWPDRAPGRASSHPRQQLNRTMLRRLSKPMSLTMALSTLQSPERTRSSTWSAFSPRQPHRLIAPFTSKARAELPWPHSAMV